MDRKFLLKWLWNRSLFQWALPVLPGSTWKFDELKNVGAFILIIFLLTGKQRERLQLARSQKSSWRERKAKRKQSKERQKQSGMRDWSKKAFFCFGQKIKFFQESTLKMLHRFDFKDLINENCKRQLSFFVIISASRLVVFVFFKLLIFFVRFP